MFPESSTGVTSLFKGINFNKILGGTNKTLGFVKQAIPIYNQVRPMWGNVKTFLNMYGAVRSEKEIEPSIKETRPMPVNKNVNSTRPNNVGVSNRIEQLNDTLTFFQ